MLSADNHWGWGDSKNYDIAGADGPRNLEDRLLAVVVMPRKR